MKLGIIRCMQTEDYCPGSRDFRTIRERKGAFMGADDIQLVGFISKVSFPSGLWYDRLRWNMQGGTAVYLGTGDVTAHSMACCADSAMMFPLGYSEGISISVDLKQLSSICPEVLKNAGVEADQLRDRFCSGKPSAIPSCSDLEHIFAPL